MALTAMDDGKSVNNTTNEKIGKVLQKLLEPNFKIKNEVYLNQFLTRLVGKNDESKATTQHNEQLSQLFCQWIVKATKLWSKSEISPHTTILSFALNLTSQLSAEEHTFVNLNCNNVFESLVGVAQTNMNKHPNISLGLVTLLCSFLEHKSGVQWMMATTHWTDVINLGVKAHTIYIRNKAHQFGLKLLEKTISFNRNFAIVLVEILVRPLKNVSRSLPSSQDSPKEFQNVELFGSLKPTLIFISEVTRGLLERFNIDALELFLEEDVYEIVERFILNSDIEDFSFELLKGQFNFLFYKMCLRLEGVRVVTHDSETLQDITTIFELIKMEMDKGHVRCVIKISDYAHGLYCTLAPRMPLCVRNGEIIEFQNQMLLFQLAPILIFSIQILCGGSNARSKFSGDDFRKQFMKKLLKLTAVRSIEMVHKWKHQLKLKTDLMEDATFILQYLMKTKKVLNRARAGIVFSALVYSLKDSITVLGQLEQVEWTPRSIQFLTNLVDTIIDIVESFDLTWRDTVETIRVMDLACEFLQYPQWTEEIILIKGLKLLKTAISKYMCPDMVLLMHSTKDSTVSQTGSIVYTRCHDSSWEIRNSALEIVLTLSQNAHTVFPALTSVLLDSELSQLVVKMAFKDSETRVRMTAFICLQELVQISETWEEIKGNSFFNDIINALGNETEEKIRKEVTRLIGTINHRQEFPPDILPRIYNIMIYAATEDLHEEVRSSAIHFWMMTWKKHLEEQGASDRSFPSHTFSKESKKIIALTDVEIRKRIIKVFNQMSRIGCLYVMRWAVLDSSGCEAASRARECTRIVLNIAKRYKVPCENIDLEEPPPSSEDDLNYEPISPASSTTMTALSPPDIGDVDDTEWENSPFFDAGSPFTSVFGNSLDFDLVTPPDSNKSPNSANQSTQNLTTVGIHPYPQFDTIQTTLSPLSIHNMPRSNVELDPFLLSDVANQITSRLNIDNIGDIDMYGGGGKQVEGFGTSELDNVISNNWNLEHSDQLLDDLFNSTDSLLLQKLYSSHDKITKHSHIKKRKKYIAPSEYLKFIFALDLEALEKTKQSKSHNEFDTILDNIIKEYSVVTGVNDIDFY